ncbi:hypothetical protein PHMEG_00030376 [Phytophthora megakarya]|uniref:Uncharacterized protein n=1 Tax=Phytophthora megakarya TaxID=4795 RepID=A0A225UYW2_9STRA|nr:hypothetical protein PHMEG_00030376 [Phytophthora megakarya]
MIAVKTVKVAEQTLQVYAPEFRWRAVVLHYAYGVPCVRVGQIFGISSRTVLRWYQQFKRCGHVMPGKRLKKTRQPPHVQRFVADYVKVHPCFYVEELQAALQQMFGGDTSGLAERSEEAKLLGE